MNFYDPEYDKITAESTSIRQYLWFVSNCAMRGTYYDFLKRNFRTPECEEINLPETQRSRASVSEIVEVVDKTMKDLEVDIFSCEFVDLHKLDGSLKVIFSVDTRKDADIILQCLVGAGLRKATFKITEYPAQPGYELATEMYIV